LLLLLLLLWFRNIALFAHNLSLYLYLCIMSVEGDIRAIIDANVCLALTLAMRTFHNGSSKHGRQVLWRGCCIAARLAQRSDLLKAELGKAETVDECLKAIGNCPDDRPVQQQVY
jgi:hypothetical protein